MVWKPNVTVAAVVEEQGHFLLVEERVGDNLVLNQPAGHLEAGESLVHAVSREVLEETAYPFLPTALTGIYRWHHAATDTTYLRICFAGDVGVHDDSRALDPDIERVVWLTPDEIQARPTRSPLVQRCLQDYLRGERYPLTLLTDLP